MPRDPYPMDRIYTAERLPSLLEWRCVEGSPWHCWGKFRPPAPTQHKLTCSTKRFYWNIGKAMVPAAIKHIHTQSWWYSLCKLQKAVMWMSWRPWSQKWRICSFVPASASRISWILSQTASIRFIVPLRRESYTSSNSCWIKVLSSTLELLCQVPYLPKKYWILLKQLWNCVEQRTPLLRAVKYNHLPCAKFLLEKGAANDVQPLKYDKRSKTLSMKVSC